MTAYVEVRSDFCEDLGRASPMRPVFRSGRGALHSSQVGPPRSDCYGELPYRTKSFAMPTIATLYVAIEQRFQP